MLKGGNWATTKMAINSISAGVARTTQLVANDVMRKTDPSAEELILLVRAWKAAFAKAQSLGWLY
jgi:hypothetical protein